MAIVVSHGIFALIGFLFFLFTEENFIETVCQICSAPKYILSSFLGKGTIQFRFLLQDLYIEIFQFKMCNVGGSKYKRTTQTKLNHFYFYIILFYAWNLISTWLRAVMYLPTW